MLQVYQEDGAFRLAVLPLPGHGDHPPQWVFLAIGGLALSAQRGGHHALQNNGHVLEWASWRWDWASLCNKRIY